MSQRIMLTLNGLLILLVGLSQGAAVQATDSFEILIPRGDYSLRGHLFEAAGEGPFPLAIVLQGMPGGESDVLGLGQRLSEAGIHALTFNYSGTYSSGGNWTMANDAADVRAVHDFAGQPEFVARYSINKARVVLGGYSHGGGVALLFAADNPEVRNVFSIGGNEFGEWARRTSRDSAFAQVIDEVFVDYVDQGWIRPADGADRELLDHVEKYDVRRRSPLLAKAQLLLVGGLDDQTTAIEDHLLPLYRSLQREGAQRVRFVVHQTDHSFSTVYDQIATDLIDWIRSIE